MEKVIKNKLFLYSIVAWMLSLCLIIVVFLKFNIIHKIISKTVENGLVIENETLRFEFTNEILNNVFGNLWYLLGYVFLIGIMLIYVFFQIKLENNYKKDLSIIEDAAISKDNDKICENSELEMVRKSLILKNKQLLQKDRYNQSKNKMIKTQVMYINHDIKTPITIIKSNAELILGELDSQNRERMKRIIGQTKIINNYVEKMQSAMEHATNDSDNSEYYASKDIIENLVSSSELFADVNEVEINVSVPEYDDFILYLNKESLEKCLIYILDNAAKFKKEKPIKFNIEKELDYLKLIVMDDGIGFDENSLKHSKELFYSSNTKKGLQNGYGIGLYYADMYISSIGGSLILENNCIAGAKVILKIPIIHKSFID